MRTWRTFKVLQLHNVHRRSLANYKRYKQYPLDKIRNIGISAHIDSGKTTLTERILFYTGRINEMHEVKGKDGVGATMDSMELERLRGITIQSAATCVEWRNHNLQIIDTPGHVDFTVEVERALRVLDSAVLVVCGASGVQCQTLTVQRQIRRYNVPHILFINKLDRPGACAYRTLDDIRLRLNKSCVLITLPIGKEKQLQGVVDLINMKACYFDGQYGEQVRIDQIPDYMKAEADHYRGQLVEQVADIDEEIGNMFLEEKTPTVDQIKQAIRRNVIENRFHPVYVGSALKNKGVQLVLNAITDYFPDPSERVNYAIDNTKSTVDGDKPAKVVCRSERTSDNPLLAFVFKLETGRHGQLTYLRVYQGVLKKGDYVYNVRTRRRVKVAKLFRMHADILEDIDEAFAGDICTILGTESSTGDTLTSSRDSMYSMESIHVANPVISMTFSPAKKMEVDGFSRAANRFQREDPTFKIIYDEESQQTIALGMGELHLEIYAARIEKEYGVKVTLGRPRVAYVDTLKAPYKFDYLHKKQSGGQGQYGRVIGIIEALPVSRILDTEFSPELTGTHIPSQHVPSIRKGFMASIKQSGITGHKVSGIKIRLQDGDHHIVDSTEIAFILAAQGAMRDAYTEGAWHTMEPVMNVEVVTPEEYQLQVVNSLLKRFAIVRGQQIRDGLLILDCQVPLNDMFGFSTTLRSSTQGRGEFSMEYERYAPVRGDVQSDLVQAYEEQLEKKKKNITDKSR